MKKYDLDVNERYALFLYPRKKYMYNMSDKQTKKIVAYLQGCGFKVIIKSRAKDPIKHEGDVVVSRTDIYPHTTMELMAASELVINTGSTAIEEAVMMEKPVIDFPIKPQRNLEFLHQGGHCRRLSAGCSKEKFEEAVKALTEKDLSESFKQAKDKYLFENGNVSDVIIDNVLKRVTNGCS